MTAVARASKPLRSKFARVTAGYDRRGFNLNSHRLNGGGLLNSWSGMRKEPDGPVLSIRYHHRPITDAGIGDAGLFEAIRLRHVHILDASAPTAQRSSLGLLHAAVPVAYNAHVPWQHAVFTDDVFGEPNPRGQTNYGVGLSRNIQVAIPAAQRSSAATLAGATVPSDYNSDVPFQHAPFTDETFGQPNPRTQAGY